MAEVMDAKVESPTGREFVFALVERQIRVRLKRTLFGMVWPAITPYFMLGIYVYVFHAVMHVGIYNYGVYLFAGLLPWTFFVQALTAANTSISSESELIRRVSFPYELLPMAAVASVAVFFLGNTALFMIYLFLTHQLHLALLPVLVVPLLSLTLFTLSGALVLALIDVYNRDVRQVLSNVFTIWFFLTPIVYRPNMAVGFTSVFKSIDPMQIIIGEFRDVFVYGHIAYPLHYLDVLLASAALVTAVVLGFRVITRDLVADV